MVVILNRAAGLPNGRAVASDADLRALFARHGVEIRIVHPDATRDLCALAREAVRGADDVIVAGGGDGTVSAVASVLAGSDKTLGVLPLGTLNHFAKDLALPLDLAAAVETIVHGRVAAVDVGEVNGRVFINNSSLGIYPNIVADRQAQQLRLARGKWTAFAWATVRALRRFPFLDLQITAGGERHRHRTAFVFIGNNQYQISGFNIGARSCLDAGHLGLYLTPGTGRFGLFRLAFRALLGGLRQAEDFEAFCVDEALIESRHRHLLVATDGEVNRMETPLRYRIWPAALRVLVPQSTEVR